MNKKIRVLVLMGGKSSEHDVSIASGTEILKNLDTKKYNVLPVIISKDGTKWILTDSKSLLKRKNIISKEVTDKDIVLRSSKYIEGVGNASIKSVDVVFIAMHGKHGEDGNVQGMLELTGIPYTGSGVLASAIGMDKEIFRKLLVPQNLKIPKFVTLHANEKYPNFKKKLGSFPYFVKPVNGGSSVGASLARNQKELDESIKLAFNYDDRVLVDEYIRGLEVTCAVIGNDNPIALPVVEIRPLKGEFFDYESKYTESGSEEIVPARISKGISEKIKKMAIDVYKAIGCKGFGRVDFILKNNKYPVVLEINTIPGMTPTSLLPKAAKAEGISYSQLVDKIIEYATEKN
ncbi:MAG: D-alanine--D-alanine ligase [Candidatus Woesebacteria bacterium]|nr:MAG: D-alanine--D-alanine ligase [Candidatus Woesebacteria bacterium]